MRVSSLKISRFPLIIIFYCEVRRHVSLISITPFSIPGSLQPPTLFPHFHVCLLSFRCHLMSFLHFFLFLLFLSLNSSCSIVFCKNHTIFQLIYIFLKFSKRNIFSGKNVVACCGFPGTKFKNNLKV